MQKLGRNAEAIADESEAIKLDPSVPEYFDNRGLSYADEGEFDRAIIDYSEAIRISSRANFLTHRGDAYQAKGDLDLAIADYDRAIKLNPAFADAYNNRAPPSEARATMTARSPTIRRRYVSIRGLSWRLRTSRPSKLSVSDEGASKAHPHPITGANAVFAYAGAAHRHAFEFLRGCLRHSRTFLQRFELA